MDNLHAKIRKLREEKDLEQEELAQMLGIAKSTVEAYENGKKQIPLRHLVLVADFFEVSVDHLLERHERPLDLKNLDLSSNYSLKLDNQTLNKNEIREAADFIQAKRRIRSYGRSFSARRQE